MKHLTFAEQDQRSGKWYAYETTGVHIVKRINCGSEDLALGYAFGMAETYGATFMLIAPNEVEGRILYLPVDGITEGTDENLG